MQIPRHDRGSPSAARRRGRVRAAALAVAVCAAGVLAPPAPGAARQSAIAPQADPQTDKFERLKKRAAKLNKDYRGELVSLEEARDAARKARRQAEDTGAELAETNATVRRMAASAYMNGGLEPTAVLTSQDPAEAMKDLAAVDYVAGNNGRRVGDLQRLARRAEESRERARSKVDEVEEIVEDLEQQRTKVKKLLDRHRPEEPEPQPPSDGGDAGGGGAAKSPLTGPYMTDRMRKVYLEVDRRFGPFSSIGCHRPGDPQDHGTGRACDFMVANGTAATGAAKAKGDAVADWAVQNASRLGIKYVIWYQRIWDSRSGGGWRTMEDRGSPTQNHMDHPHISVL